MSFHSHNRYRAAIHFRWDLPRIDPAWVALLGSIQDVRAVAGDAGVRAFIAEWRKRGYLECADADAERLIAMKPNVHNEGRAACGASLSIVLLGGI